MVLAGADSPCPLEPPGSSLPCATQTLARPQTSAVIEGPWPELAMDIHVPRTVGFLWVAMTGSANRSPGGHDSEPLPGFPGGG